MELFNTENVWGYRSTRKNKIHELLGRYLFGDASLLYGNIQNIYGHISELSGCCSRIGGNAGDIACFSPDLSNIQKLITKYEISKICFISHYESIDVLIYFHFSTRKLLYSVSKKENSLLQKLDHRLSIFIAKYKPR